MQARFCNPRPPRHSLRLARARVLGHVLFYQHRVTSSAVRGARRTRTVRLLDGLILARSLTSPQPPIGSYLPCIPEFSGNKTATCTVVSTSSASVARSTPMKLSASTVQQLLSPPARRDHRVCEKKRFDPCSNMACVEYSSVVFD